MPDIATPSAEALAVWLESLLMRHPFNYVHQSSACLRESITMLRSLASERDALRAALDAEREACAKLCDSVASVDNENAFIAAAQMCAATIRARTAPPQQEPTA